MHAHPMPGRRPAARSRQRGGAMIELSLTLILMVLLGAALVQFGRTIWYYQVVQKSTRDTARYLARVPMSERMNAARNLEMRRTALAMMRAGLREGGVGQEPVLQLSCAPAPLCVGSLRPTLITVVVTVWVVDTSWFTLFESSDNLNEFAVMRVESRSTVPYIGA